MATVFKRINSRDYSQKEIIDEWNKTKKDCNFLKLDNNRRVQLPCPVYGPRYISETPFPNGTIFVKVRIEEDDN